MASQAALDALGHAVSGSVGTAISTTALYPLDLVTTRLKAQRLEAGTDKYTGILAAVKKIPKEEGGILALYNGLGPDVAKSVVDSFLFFGFYNFLRNQGKQKSSVLQELAVGALAGACAKFCTTPLSNVVTRRQMTTDQNSIGQIFRSLIREGGVLSLWSGYSATLVLTLNPSITFFVNRRLAERIIPALEEEDVPIAWVAFFVAACSKAAATAMTFPFQAGKTRLQMGQKAGQMQQHSLGKGKEKQDKDKNESRMKTMLNRLAKLLNQSIWGMILRIVRSEGVLGLYVGLHGELLKSFFSHGVTMLTKGVIHRLVIRLWYASKLKLHQTRPLAK